MEKKKNSKENFTYIDAAVEQVAGQIQSAYTSGVVGQPNANYEQEEAEKYE
ncbi:hypothetical protein [Bacillus coahuilensis]|uniref:hypothetical protein n=1 Tax=Bacillus coahuilensis TaxID=408580 RepID=UPI000AC37BEA|nr:hypothetical protein [Bacillus coahuilensis]